MLIYLLRHGIAEDGGAGLRDPDRALTAEGRKKTQQVIAAAKHASFAPSLILTSPYRRAVETAQVVKTVLQHDKDPLKTKALVPGSTPQQVWDEVRAHGSEESVLLVGHEPLFSSTAAYLLGVPSLQVDFKKSALVCVEADRLGPQPHAVLKWMLTPKLAR